MSVISKADLGEDLQLSETVQNQLESLERRLLESKDDSTKLVLTKIVDQLKTIKDRQLAELLDKLGWHKMLIWCRLCIERGMTSDEDRLVVANEVAERWSGYMGGMAVGYYTWNGVRNAVPAEGG